MTQTVLVVDDDAAIRILLVDLLAGAGYRMLAAGDGAEALDVAARERPDLVISDVRMPRLDGPSLLRALAARGQGAIPAILISAEDRPEGVAARQFLSKPLDLAALLQAVEECLGPAVFDPEQSGERPVVLIVEDERTMSDLLIQLLTPEGYVVEHVGTGAEALTRLAAGGVDLVLLDLMLPGMDGLELCLHARANESDVYLPIIMLTALGSEAQRHAGFTAGADDFVAKPFRVEDLLDRVRVWVHARQRLKATHARLRHATERRARQDTALLLARWTGRELRAPLDALTAAVEEWAASHSATPEDATLVARLRAAAGTLSTRVDALAENVQSASSGTTYQFLQLRPATDTPPCRLS